MRDDGFIGNPAEQFCLHRDHDLAQAIHFLPEHLVDCLQHGSLDMR